MSTEATPAIPEPAGIEDVGVGKDPLEAAAMLFKLYWPYFSSIVEELSTKSLRRLIRAMAAQPLEEASINLKLDIERKAFAIFEKLFISKTLIVIDTMYQSQAEVEQIKNQASPQQPTEDTQPQA